MPTTIPLNAPETEDFRALALAATRLAARLVAALPEAQQDVLQSGVKGGARIFLEFGPLPRFERVSLLLIEAEGRRHPLATLRVSEGPLQ